MRDETTFCYEIRDGKTHRLPVRLGLRDGNRVEILKFQLRSHAWRQIRQSGINPTGQETIVAARRAN